ncbi:MAG: metallophosphoesterase [Chloroflexota bacterium]
MKKDLVKSIVRSRSTSVGDDSVGDGFVGKDPEGDTYRVGICSDTHLWFGGTNVVGETVQLQSYSEILFTTLLTELKQAELDLILHLGDVTCGGGSFYMPHEEFYASNQRIADGLMSLGSHVFALPGNHDCPRGGNWSFYEDLWGLESGIGITIDLPTARLILLNSHGHSDEQIEENLPNDPVYGWLSDGELNRLEEGLATADGRPVLLFIHQLLLPWSQTERPWRSFYGVRNGDKVLKLLECYGNVRGVFQGHAHRLDLQRHSIGAGECAFVVLPALIEYPLGWLQLHIGDDVEVELKSLPLPQVAQVNLESGTGQAWRAGQPEWHKFVIPLG